MFESLLPASATKLERDLERVITGRMAQLPLIDTAVQIDPYRCDERYLPWLAESYGVTYWDSAWTTERKRAQVAGAMMAKMLYGTSAGVAAAIEYLGRPVTVTEWHEMDGKPGTFRVDIELSGNFAADAEIAQPDTLAAINRAKRASQHGEVRMTSRRDAAIALDAAPGGSTASQAVSAKADFATITRRPDALRLAARASDAPLESQKNKATATVAPLRHAPTFNFASTAHGIAVGRHEMRITA